MTRKRVGQGLIEAFSTTCESCGGRGIHIHSEPVNKVALEKDMEQRYSKTSKVANNDLDDEDNDDSGKDSDDDSDIEETSNSLDKSSDEVVEEAPAATTGRRKGRRAVSTGVISTN
jgi:ribonuclease E